MNARAFIQNLSLVARNMGEDAALRIISENGSVYVTSDDEVDVYESEGEVVVEIRV